MPQELPNNEVHIWVTEAETIENPALIRAYHRLMNAKEATRQARFHFPKHRHQFLVGRALIRTTLSRYASVAPENWTFVENEYGRPELAPEHADIPIRFNLSHTDGLIVFAVVSGRELGVDVENITRGGDLVPIADRFFSKAEVADLHTVPPARQEDRFFDYWTLKEAYIKARGMGLSIPLGDFGYKLSDDHDNIEITIDASQGDDPKRWMFRQWRHSPDHKLALCVEREPDPKMTVVLREVVPLDHVKPFEPRVLRTSF